MCCSDRIWGVCVRLDGVRDVLRWRASDARHRAGQRCRDRASGKALGGTATVGDAAGIALESGLARAASGVGRRLSEGLEQFVHDHVRGVL